MLPLRGSSLLPKLKGPSQDGERLDPPTRNLLGAETSLVLELLAFPQEGRLLARHGCYDRVEDSRWIDLPALCELYKVVVGDRFLGEAGQLLDVEPLVGGGSRLHELRPTGSARHDEFVAAGDDIVDGRGRRGRVHPMEDRHKWILERG
jgi:hypothetical protein